MHVDSRVHRRSGLRAADGGALLAALVATSGALALPPDNHWNSPTDFAYTLPGIPDFDQQRVGLQAPPGSNPGAMYCGPTSGLNKLAFMAAHGFPTILPPGQAGFDWQLPANYAIATGHINVLADPGYMFCQCEVPPFTGGTSIGGMVKGLRQAIGNLPISVAAYAPNGTFAPNLNQIAAAGLNNNIMSMAYGYYKVVGFTPGGYRIVQRVGGHFVTVAGVQRKDPICKIWVRNPADEMPVNTLAQTPFVDEMFHVDNGWVLVQVGPASFQWRWMSRLSAVAGAPYPGLGQIFQLIDAVVGARPRHAVGIKPDGKLALLKPGGWLGGGCPLAGQCLVCEDIATDFTVLSADTAPDLNGAVVIAQDDAAAARGPRPGNIRLVDSATGEIVIVGQVDGAERLAVGGNRSVYVVAGGTELHRLEIPVGAEQDVPEEGGIAGDPKPIVLPHAADAITIDDTDGQVVLLSLADRKVMRVALSLEGDIEVQDVPEAVALGTKASLSLDADDSTLWLATDASSTIFGLAEPAADGQGFEVETITLPEIAAPTSIDFLGDGHMVVGQVDGLIEIEPVADAWQVVPDSAFASVECAVPAIVIDEDRTNFDPEVHEGPEWVNIDPIELVPGNPEPDPVCQGDLNGDGLVDSADLGVLMAAWGPDLGNPADFNGDSMVDGVDLGVLLAAWGACP